MGGRTPLQSYSAREKARLASKAGREAHLRVRHNSKLHHISLGRAHKGKPIKLFVADRDIRVFDAHSGELIRQLTLDPTRDYQPIGGA